MMEGRIGSFNCQQKYLLRPSPLTISWFTFDSTEYDGHELVLPIGLRL
jgi:hypothetical protein